MHHCVRKKIELILTNQPYPLTPKDRNIQNIYDNKLPGGYGTSRGRVFPQPKISVS